VRKFHDIPRFAANSDAWKKRLLEVLEAERFDLVIPCVDPAIIPLQMHRKDFEAVASIRLLDDETFRVTSNKRETTGLAKSLGIPVPSEVELTSRGQLDRALPTIPLPLVLKPLRSFTPDNLSHHHDVRKAFSAEEARQIAHEMLASGPVLLQENFIGRGHGVEVIADQGRILSAFQHLRLHEPVHGGAASYRVSVPLNPDLYEATTKLIASLKYTGVAMLEFKVNPGTGKWVFLEINARFWGSLPLAVAAGIDFPWYLYELSVNGKKEFNRTYRVGLFCRDWFDDIDWFRSNLAADRTDPYLHTVPLPKVFAEFLNILALRERSDTLALDDPKPFLAEATTWMGHKYRGLARKIGMWVKSQHAVKALIRRKIVRELCRESSILFVCTGNIYRSPFAQTATQLLSPDLHALSTGILSNTGRRCPENAIAAARVAGIDLTNHISTQVTQDLIRKAGVVLVFDTIAYEYLREAFPSARRKFHFLGAFLDDRQVIIEDPMGSDIDVIERSFRTIESALVRMKEAYEEARSAERAKVAHT